MAEDVPSSSPTSSRRSSAERLPRCAFDRIGLPNPSECIRREVLSVSVRDIEHLTLSTRGVSWHVLLCGPHEQTKKGVSAFAFLTCPCWPVPDTGSSNLLEQCRLCGR
jgi:hypothetical protein